MFPWRNTSDPYSIWLSEVMLQQTQVETVIPYYINWIHKYPTIYDVHHESIDNLLKMWEGIQRVFLVTRSEVKDSIINRVNNKNFFVTLTIVFAYEVILHFGEKMLKNFISLGAEAVWCGSNKSKLQFRFM